MSDHRLLRRARWWTLIGGSAAAIAVALLVRPADGLGLAVGAVWSALNLRALEGLVGAAVLPRDRRRDRRRVFLWSLAKIGVYVLAIWLLIVAPSPVVSMAHGLTVMLAALVLAGLTTRSTAVREVPQRGDDADA